MRFQFKGQIQRAVSSLLPLMVAAAVATTGCAGGQASVDDVKMSQAEHDLSADAFHRGRYREALDHAQKAIEHDGNSAEAAYLAGIIMLVFCATDEASSDCRYDEAERYMRGALEARPDMRDAKNSLGVILVHQKRPKEAIELLEPLAHDMVYRSPEKAWGNLGWAHLEAGDTDRAIDALQRSIAAQPSFCVGHYRLGLAYEKKKQYAAARGAFTRALGVDEGDCGRLQEAFLARARVGRHLGKMADVRKDLKECRSLAIGTPTGKRCDRHLRSLP